MYLDALAMEVGKPIGSVAFGGDDRWVSDYLRSFVDGQLGVSSRSDAVTRIIDLGLRSQRLISPNGAVARVT